jgi:tetratricopeptide (TPR) repeat protein
MRLVCFKTADNIPRKQVRAALTCAEQADHNGLRAWTHGTAALIAEWTHQHRRAVEFAQCGQRFAPTVDCRVRLAALEARAAARAGDRCLALDALSRAADARDVAAQRDELVEFGGLLTFPAAKQHYYAGSTYALLGEAESAQKHALLAIGLYETGPVEQRSYGDEALARVDVTTARLALDDLDGAREALNPVLELPPERRIEQLTVGISRVRSALALPRYARAQIARTIAQDVDHYQAECAAHSLLLTR